MAKRRRGACKRVTFKRARAGGKVRPKSQWVTVSRCEGRKLKAHNRRQCRRGGAKGKKGKAKFRAMQFVPC
jgi:hypothetical protein